MDGTEDGGSSVNGKEEGGEDGGGSVCGMKEGKWAGSVVGIEEEEGIEEVEGWEDLRACSSASNLAIVSSICA